MKRIAFGALGVVLAFACVAAFTLDAHAARYVTEQWKWATNADTTLGSTTFLEDENDSTRTVSRSTAVWDFGLNGTTTSAGYATIAFVATTAHDGAADSVYYALEKSWDQGNTWTLGSLSAAAGASAVLVGTGGPTFAIFVGTLRFDWDTAVEFGLSGIPPTIRLKVAGDQGSTTPALAGLKCFISFPASESGY